MWRTQLISLIQGYTESNFIQKLEHFFSSTNEILMEADHTICHKSSINKTKQSVSYRLLCDYNAIRLKTNLRNVSNFKNILVSNSWIKERLEIRKYLELNDKDKNYVIQLKKCSKEDSRAINAYFRKGDRKIISIGSNSS